MYARYTEYLRDLMLNEHTKPLLDKALSTYPLYEAQKIYDLIPTRSELNAKLLNHYKYREIGFETVGRFLDELEITMNEIMPRYNELFKTVETMAELPSPFDNVDVTETFEQERSDSASSSGGSTVKNTGSATDESSGTSKLNSNGHSKHIFSDTPQDDLSIAAKDIDNVNYASNAEWTADESESSSETSGNATRTTNDESEGTSNSSSQSSGTVKHTFTKKGNQGVNTYAHDMNEFRTSIIDVVDQIINDARIAELFMMVY